MFCKQSIPRYVSVLSIVCIPFTLSIYSFQASIRLYFHLSYYETAVQLALGKGEVTLAKENVKKAKGLSRSSRKRLWMLIATYLLDPKQQQGGKEDEQKDDRSNRNNSNTIQTANANTSITSATIKERTRSALLLIQEAGRDSYKDDDKLGGGKL